MTTGQRYLSIILLVLAAASALLIQVSANNSVETVSPGLPVHIANSPALPLTETKSSLSTGLSTVGDAQDSPESIQRQTPVQPELHDATERRQNTQNAAQEPETAGPMMTAETSDEIFDELPGSEIGFELGLDQSDYHQINGRAQSDIGQITFNSHLMPNNEVKLSLILKQQETEDFELVADIDIAHFTMELNGNNRSLNNDHKIMLDLLSWHLRNQLSQQYEGYEVPDHGYLLAQMISYWSLSPEGYVHEKRSIVSQQ